MSLLLVVSCSEPPSAPTRPVGTLYVSVRTTGGDVDLDGYEIVVGTEVSKQVGVNENVVITGVSTVTQDVALRNVAENCLVSGGDSRTTTVLAGTSVAIAFEVECATTGIEISIRTSGSDTPQTFALLVNDQPLGGAGANGSRVVSRLPVGDHTVALILPERCIVLGASKITARVVNRSVIKVSIEVSCGTAQRLEKTAYVLDSVTPNDGASWIVLANSDLTNGVALIEGQSPDWSPDGTQLVFSDLTCVTPPWDFEVCEPGLVIIDPETRVTRRLGAAGFATEPAWAPTGDVIAFVRQYEPAPRDTRLYLLKLDGSPPVEISTPGVASVGNPAWSPNGQRIAFTCVMSSNIYDVCVINRDGTGLVRLTGGAQLNIDPAWSPDGNTIAFTTTRFQNPWDYGRDIAVIPADGGGTIRRVASGSDAAWSPDGSKLVFAGERGDGLFTVNLDGSNLTRRTAGRHHSPAWRPEVRFGCAGCWD